MKSVKASQGQRKANSIESRFARILEQYKVLSIKSEGEYSNVLHAKCIETGRQVAIKYMREIFRTEEQT